MSHSWELVFGSSTFYHIKYIKTPILHVSYHFRLSNLWKDFYKVVIESVKNLWSCNINFTIV